MKKIKIFLFLSVVLVSLFFQNNQYLSGKNPDTNILIITLDTTRADRIGIYGYEPAQTPNIDTLARKGILFENAYTPVPLTLPAHCSIFTGTTPLVHRVRNNGRYRLPEQIDTLAEILKRRSYTTAAFISSFTVDSRFGLDQGFDTYNDYLQVKKGQVKTYHSERPAEMVFKDFAAWFDTHSKKKFFAWVHFFDPHMPYTPPEPFKSRFQQNPYDGEIAYMDVYVGKIIDLLKEKEVLQHTLMVVAGDHGEAFGEHGEFGHMMFCYEENIKVPLIFYFPHRLPGNMKIASRANLTDIMPTLLDFLDITLPSPVQGTSLLPLMKGKSIEDRMFYIETVFPGEAMGCAPVIGLIKGDYKFIDLPKPELYHLENDPGEKENLFFKKNIAARKLKQSLSRMIKQYNGLAFKTGRKLSPEEERKLRTLGYFSTAKEPSKQGKLPDPKDKIDSLSEFIKGNHLRGQGETLEAVTHFNRAIEMNPTFSWPYSTLALVYFENGKVEEAVKVLEKGMERCPEEYQLKIDYAMLLKKQSRGDKAIETLETLTRQEGVMVDVGAEVFYLLGDLYAEKNNPTKAISCYREALETEPENRVIKQKLVYLLHQSQELSEALKIYQDLEKETPNDTGLLLNMAILYRQLKRYDLSKSYYRKIIKGKKPPLRVYYNYALVLAKTGDFKEAILQMQYFINNYAPNDALKKAARRYLEKWKNGKME
jgi:arylsulfatase A-like enzyme/Flp pilus assembly protein TadD